VQPHGVRRWLRRGRVALDLLRGTPLWVAWWAVDEYARVLRETVREWRPDIVQFEYHIMGQYLSALGDYPAARVLVQHDPAIGAVQRGSATLPGRLLAPLDQRAWQRYETALVRKVDAVVVFTHRDAALLAPLAGATPVVRIPLGGVVPPRGLSAVGTTASTLLFVGSFSHPPNVDAADRLINEILPRVRSRRPEVRLQLVGGNLPPALRQHAGSAVELTGAVPEVAPYLDRASLVVLPLRLGGGMRVKTLEALAAGKAIVASPLAVEGLELADGREYLRASSDQEFADRIVELLDRDGERQRLGTAARAWAEANLSWARTADQYEDLYRRLPGRR
jgi:polysaccharide biosynthesis protein PslH